MSGLDSFIEFSDGKAICPYDMLAIRQDKPGQRTDAPCETGLFGIFTSRSERKGNIVRFGPFVQRVLADLRGVDDDNGHAFLCVPSMFDNLEVQVLYTA